MRPRSQPRASPGSSPGTEPLSDPVVTPRQLNRALLERQLLLDRGRLSLTDALEQVGGLQTQYAPAGYIGLWSRLVGFERPMLTHTLEERQVIQATLMRATIHMVSAADYWPMTAGIRRVRREWFESATRGAVGTLDTKAAAGAIRDELADGPLPMKELTDRVVARGLPATAARWAGMWVDLVRAPPSGTWERRRADLYALAERWIPPVEVTEDQGIELLIRRYLGAFGPGGLKEIASWMGHKVAQIRRIADAMGLRRISDESGKPLLDLPEATLPDADSPAPARFLPVWDATLLVHARRKGILPEEHRARVFNTKTPHSVNTFLVDGQVAGTWRYDNGRVELSPFERLAAADRNELEAEGERLAAFHG